MKILFDRSTKDVHEYRMSTLVNSIVDTIEWDRDHIPRKRIHLQFALVVDENERHEIEEKVFEKTGAVIGDWMSVEMIVDNIFCEGTQFSVAMPDAPAPPPCPKTFVLHKRVVGKWTPLKDQLHEKLAEEKPVVKMVWGKRIVIKKKPDRPSPVARAIDVESVKHTRQNKRRRGKKNKK